MQRTEERLAELLDGQIVAVVGNATSLLDHRYGSAIDKEHHHVIRINEGIPGDRRDATGGRMTIWAGRQPPGGIMGTRPNGAIGPVLSLSPGYWEGLEQVWVWDKVIIVPKPYIDRIVRFKPDSREDPTTGFLVLTALMTCKPKLIRIFGFDWFSTVSWTSGLKHPCVETGETHGRQEFDALARQGLRAHPTMEGVYEIVP